MNMFKMPRANRRWYEVIWWWETRRIIYNVIMCSIGFASFYIGFVTIPLLYLVVGAALNVIYTLGWVTELVLIKKITNESIRLSYPTTAFIGYLALSAFFVLGIALQLVI
jgi:hypothetical protein